MIDQNPNETLKSENGSGKLWRPLRDLAQVDTTVDTITNLQRRVQSLTSATTQLEAQVSTSPTADPLQVNSVSATESPYKTQTGQMVSLVSVSFTRDVHDTQFAGIEIWFTGYNGSSLPQLMAQGSQSPVQFLCETTHETVTVTVVSYHLDKSADFSHAPTTTVLLDGVISAPAAPSIAQTLTGVALGYQFAFNQLASLSADLVDAYRVYRNSTNSFGSATLLRTFKHDATNSGAIVVQDNVGGGQTYYYWVTAVNTSGLESSSTAAQSGAVLSGVAGSRSVVANNTASTFSGANPCSQSGTSTTINIAAASIKYGFGTVSYSSGSTNPGSYGTFYVYADDPDYQGGAVTYLTTTDATVPFAADNRIYFGKIITVAGGGGTGVGGGGGCPLSGAPVKLYGRPEWWSMRVLPNEDFITIVTHTGRKGTFTPNDRRYSNRGLLTLTEWQVGDLALTEDGEERVTEISRVHLPGATIDSYEGVHGHVYSAWGFIGHNMKNNPN
jgi:hypothetical protein